MTQSPYTGDPSASWVAVTQQLLNAHPLKASELRDAALAAWGTLWHTTIGTGETAPRLSELRVPATIVGYFFEVLLVRELEHRQPGLWRGTQSKDEKDLVCVADPSLSVEIKASGQAGFRVYGNRSYGQKSENELLVKKEKSGYFITVNFYQRTLNLLRFGWIDADDWVPQRASTGQMAGLRQAVYDYKLIPIVGVYRQHAPVFLLDGVGPRSADELGKLGIQTISDLLTFPHDLPGRLARIKTLNADFLAGCCD
jgi:hypothetical protein